MADRPLYILLPGIHGTAELFPPAPPGIDTQIITYPQDPALRFDDYVAHVRDHLPTDRPYVIFGESFAGPIAVTLAGERPAPLRGLVLCNTFTRRPGSPLYLLLPMRAICRLPMPRWMGKRYLVGDTDLQAPTKAADRGTPPDVYAARFRIALKLDVTETFRRLDLPILCLLGRRDHFIKPGPLAQLAAAHPRADVQWFDAPHLLIQSQPEACWQTITRWTSHATTTPPPRPAPPTGDAA